jgi:aldehyde:ferredoxin oxidoreductase
MMSTSGQIAFLMDLYEKGIVTEKDTDGIPMKWDNVEAMYIMIEKIANRESCGAIFAEGIVKAAEKIGKGADKYAYHIRGLEPSSHSLYHPGWAVGSAISETGDAIRAGSVFGRHHFPKPETDLHEALNNYLYTEKMSMHIPDFLGLCRFVVGYLPDPYYGVDTMAKLASCITGINIDEDMLYMYCDRKINLSRAFDVREGITRNDDSIPERFFKEPSPVKGKPLDRDTFNKMIEEAYAVRGWDSNGIPKRETLLKVGLEDVADDLEERKFIRR